ncbi:autoinducer binding domain-containing protein [Bradyrhizobium sp. BR 1432]|uniref:autoinducer binding domain-containing protein n=1 Tax=Bradyrhizobium sp. BR 1432 TaxID=3447966 RepID=UPI003EE7415A
MSMFSFIECANRTQSLPLLFDLLVSGASKEGFNEVAYAAVTFPEPLRLPRCAPPLIAVSFSADWCHRYLDRKYYAVDPAVHRAPMFSGPFLWEQLRQRCKLRPDEQRVLEESRQAGLKHGVSVPLFGAFGRVSVVLFASQLDDADPQGQVPRLAALASNFHLAFSEIAPPADSSGDTEEILSERQKECLSLVAKGKSSWHIGKHLNISENTVNFHIRSVRQKMGTRTRTQALLKAIQLGLIDCSEIDSTPSEQASPLRRGRVNRFR